MPSKVYLLRTSFKDLETGEYVDGWYAGKGGDIRWNSHKEKATRLSYHTANILQKREGGVIEEAEETAADRLVDAVYHACRLSFNAGADAVDWGYVVHALREGLDLDPYVTRYLTEEEKEKLSLKELIEKLKECRM